MKIIYLFQENYFLFVCCIMYKYKSVKLNHINYIDLPSSKNNILLKAKSKTIYIIIIIITDYYLITYSSENFPYFLLDVFLYICLNNKNVC